MPLSFWVGAFCILIVAAGSCLWLFWPQRMPLFSNLQPQDASQIASILEKSKLPFQLTHDGTVIQMEPELIPRARLLVFENDLNLKGGVGFEIFSGNDLGMTEFSQHVNFTRALQGEITRSLLTIEGVEAARVHVSLPDPNTRRANAAAPKVAITLHAREPISRDAVRGIQRFVSAAVPGVAQKDVVIVDQRGISLTPSNSVTEADVSGDDGSPVTARLAQKAAIEQYLEKKAKKLMQALVPAPGTVEVVVDVTLSEKSRRFTKEEVLPSGTLRGMPIGVLHKSSNSQDDEVSSTTDDGASARAVPRSRAEDLEFKSGRTVEQVDDPMGATEKISLSLVIASDGNVPAEANVRKAVMQGLGLNEKRGDGLSVIYVPSTVAKADAVAPLVTSPLTGSSVASVPVARSLTAVPPIVWIAAASAFVVVAITLLLVGMRRRTSPAELADEMRRALRGTP